MKTKLTFALIMIFGILIIGCKQKEQKVEVEEVKIDLINDEFPEAKAEVMVVLEELKQTIKDGDVDKLISGHAYGPKFTEFKNGERRNDGKENEEYERGIFSNVTEVVKFDYDDLKIAVYGNVANVTFHSNFHFKFGENEAIVNDQITLLLVKTENGWKFVHEHHSPLKKVEE
jgi:ketosteroid isomerase-like protein